MSRWSMADLDYDSIPALRHSHARAYAEHGAGYFHALTTGALRVKETDALRLGRPIHAAILEPERFAYEYAIRPKCHKGTKVGKRDAATLEVCDWLAPKRKPWVTEPEMEMILRMRDAVAAEPYARRLIEMCDLVERPGTWVDQDFESGLTLKRRVDLGSSKVPLIVDLKSTTDAHPKAFAESVARYGYDTQGAFYSSGEAAERGIDPKDVIYVLIAVEKNPPHRVGIYELKTDEQWMVTGRLWCRRVLGEIAERHRTSDWRDAWEGKRSELPVPRWYEEARSA
jgi:PDDEXK-like domain of unknown function (DUF3799)